MLGGRLLSFAQSTKSKVHYLALKGDVCCYISEVAGDEGAAAKAEALQTYSEAEALAKKELTWLSLVSYEELGDKMRKLRLEKDSGKGGWFSFIELNERLAKLRELEEKEMESRFGGASFRELRESLQSLEELDSKKKANNIFIQIICLQPKS